MSGCTPTASPECAPPTQFQIRALESQKRQQELVLRRKTQEVSEAGPTQPPRFCWRRAGPRMALPSLPRPTGATLGCHPSEPREVPFQNEVGSPLPCPNTGPLTLSRSGTQWPLCSPAWHSRSGHRPGSGHPIHWVPLCSAQVSALRRLAKPMSERAAGRVGLKPPMLDSGAEVSASTTSSEAESGARSVSSIVRQWNRKINHFVGDHPASAGHGARPAR